MIIMMRDRLRPYALPEGTSGKSGGGGGGGTLSNSLVAHWHFDEASGPRVDSVGGVSLAVTGSPTQAAGKLGFSAANNGSNSTLLSNTSFGSKPWSTNSQFECNFWAWLNDTGNRAFFYIGTSHSSSECAFIYSNTASFFEAWANGVQLNLSSYGIPAINTWFNISLGDDGTNAFIYINNVLITSAAHIVSTGATWQNMYVLGNGASTFGLNGRIDCMSIWLNRSLTPTERGQLYNSGAGLDYPYP